MLLSIFLIAKIFELVLHKDLQFNFLGDFILQLLKHVTIYLLLYTFQMLK
jgi:hypothetical protein